jgi:hypothetical protein
MEPANMKAAPDHDSELEQMLLAANPPLADGGFSTRVVAALPRKSQRSAGRFAMCAAGAVVGVAFAIQRGASWTTVTNAGTEVGQALASLAALAADPWTVLGLVITGLALVYVFRPIARHGSWT